MRWVKETLPPRPRARWLLITMRLSMSSLAGTERTLVAVGTVRLAVMLTAVRADAPRGGAVLAAAAGAGAAGLTGRVAGGAGGTAAGAGGPAAGAGCPGAAA